MEAAPGSTPAPPAESAVLLHGGTVLTMSAPGARAEAVLLVGDRIEAVGTTSELEAAATQLGASRVDLAGGALLPAFIDAHHHMCLAMVDDGAPSLELPNGSGLEELLQVVRSHVASLPAGETGWVRLHGYDAVRIGGVLPTRAQLDAACPDRPLLLMALSLHEGIANSRGLDALGIGRSFEDPPGGRIGRDRRGEPTGLLVERVFFSAEATSRSALMDQVGADERWIDACERHGRRLLALGIARIADAAVPPELDVLYVRAAREGRLPLTVHRMPVGAASIAEPREADAFANAVASGAESSPMLAPTSAAKLFLDGGERCAVCMSIVQSVRSIGRQVAAQVRGTPKAVVAAAACSEHLHLTSRFRFMQGMQLWEDDGRLDAVVQATGRAGLPVALHAIGNVAIEQALGAIDRADAAGARVGVTRIEHASFADAKLASRMAASGVHAVVQPGFLHRIGDRMLLTTGRGPMRPFPLRLFLDHGVPVAGSSDWPCGPSDVLLAVEAAVTRRTEAGKLLVEGEAVGAEEILRAYTVGSATTLGVEDEVGSIAPGMRADLVLLGADPTAVAPLGIAEIPVRRTWVAGRVAYDAAD